MILSIITSVSNLSVFYYRKYLYFVHKIHEARSYVVKMTIGFSFLFRCKGAKMTTALRSEEKEDTLIPSQALKFGLMHQDKHLI